MARREQFLELRKAAPAILPSMLMCDFANLKAEIERIEAAAAPALHLDVMDGVFVDNLTYGLPIVEACRRSSRLPLDVHLMITEPLRYVPQFVAAGADALTIHVEATDELGRTLQAIRQQGAAAGLALNPQTPLKRIEPYLEACDMVLVMSVQPGFGAQEFDPVALEKLASLRDRQHAECLLQVDGGVNTQTIARCVQAGAQLLVVGSAIFRQPDYRQAIDQLRSEALRRPS